jgi:uncharacterized protein
LLREGDLPLRLLEGRGYLDYLGPQDEPWLRVLLAEMARFEGRRARELAERLAEPLPCEAPYFKHRAASRVLWRLWRRESRAAIPPVTARSRLFTAAAGSALARPDLLAQVAAEMGIDSAALEESLLADIPGERIVRAPESVPTATDAAARINLALAQAVLMRASTVSIQLEGNARPIVRLAKLRGLICALLEPAGGHRRPTLEISGPFSLFRHTLLYGRALAELLPHLAWCARFDLQAAVRLRGRLVDINLCSGDPIRPADQPPPFDSRLEERFARDFGRLAPDWDLIREPEPVRSGGTLIFPDFLLRHRLTPERWLLVEIAGFWTPEYLQRKLTHLRAARLQRFLLCIDEDRACAPADLELPREMAVLRFRKKLDAAAVLRVAAG